MMEAYMDESGIHGGYCKAVRCGGFCWGRRQWVSFEKQWAELLKEFGVPEDVGFHANKFFKKDKSGERFGVFRGWGDDKAKDFLDGLLTIIESHRLYATGGSVDLTYFYSLPHNMKCWLTGGEL